MGNDQQVASPGASNVPHALVFEQLLALLFLACSGKLRRHHSTEHPMQRVVGSSMDELRRWWKLGRRVDRNDDWPFKSFGTVDRDDLHGLVRGVDAAFGTLGPQ